MTLNNKERARRAGSKTFHRFQCPTVRPVLMVKKVIYDLLKSQNSKTRHGLHLFYFVIHGGRHGERFIKSELTL